MKKGRIVGIILAFVLVIGIGFGVQQVIANRGDHKPATALSSKAASSSSQKAASQSSNAKANPKKNKTKENSRKSKASSTSGKSNKSSKSANHDTTANKQANSKSTASHSAATSTQSQAAKASTHKHAGSSANVTNSHHAKKAAAKDDSIGTAYIKVSGYKKTLYAGHMKISKSATAFSLLKRTHLKLVYQSSPHVYVSSINGLKQNDIKVGSGWMYSVNSKFVDKAADQKRITPGDTVHWYFSVNGLSGK